MRPSREQFQAWAEERPDATLADAREAHPGLAETTLRRWFASRNEPLSAPVERPRKGSAPVEEIDPTAVEGLVAIVGGVHGILRRRVAKMAEGGAVDRDEAQGLLSLARLASELIEVHPGLLRAVKGPAEADPGVALEDIRKAFGLDDAGGG